MRCVIFLALIYGTLSQIIEDTVLEEFVNGNHLFAAAVYKEVSKNEKGNFIVSPFSVETVLALTNEGAKEDTSEELVTSLYLPKTKENVQKVFKSILPKLRKSNKDLKLLSANKIYVRPGLELEEDFNTTAANVYSSGVSSVDFSNNVKASETINNWVEDNTNHKIKNLLKPADITEDTSIILVNALYFSGKWESEFKAYGTYKKKFFKNKDKAVEIDTMFQSEFLKYYENSTLNAKFLELAYRGANVSMTIVLPNDVDGLAKLEENIKELLVAQPFTKSIVEVNLPKFSIETNIPFKLLLQKLGVKKLFTTDADLSGFSLSDKNLVVSEVIQKSFINVTETGTEAAAATAAISFNRNFIQVNGPEPYKFQADHPFLYLIKLDNTIIFIGRYIGPK